MQIQIKTVTKEGFRLASEIKVDEASYRRETGRAPKGRAFWTFMLLTDRVTERDHLHNPSKCEGYGRALRKAIELAVIRRCHTVRVLP